MTLPNRWTSQLAALAGWLVAALLLGWWFGGVGWWLAGALALYTAHVLRNVFLLEGVLDGRKRVLLFATRGLWAEIFARVDRVRAKARNRKKKYHRLLREVRESTGALSDGGIILNAEHEIVWFNPAATTLLGLNPAADIGSRIDNLLRHPDFVAYLAEPLPEPITVPSPREEGGWLTVQIIPYGTDQRLAIVRDITREVSLERTRRDFVANASHELRSPLTVIAGYLDALADDAEMPPSWKGPVGEMQRQAERMTRILRDLIELTRLEAAGGGAPLEPVDVVAMLELMAREFPAAGNRPAVSLKIESDVALLGSESELHSIFYNLVNNAVRFTPPAGTVQIVWKTEGDAAVFAVVDTGIGIPEEQIPRITERFYRVDPGRSRASGGTGLGLAIVKHALQRHEGKLSIRSVEGQGSTFACSFPAARVAFRGGVAQAAL
ncbi:MAG TPA: phosphate regulon sensor histidine kinase PhoR [Gammaproteobacteria bacterium]|nr:phosphate regulon sensor histidine kinase PhoR [Gammaproteobacteria bacterium]